ncbi:MAG TPA: hypothetical protein VF250_07530 [Conexibacter sp.]
MIGREAGSRLVDRLDLLEETVRPAAMSAALSASASRSSSVSGSSSSGRESSQRSKSSRSGEDCVMPRVLRAGAGSSTAHALYPLTRD